MIYNPEKHHRRSIRLKDYDYSKQGLYYVTICTQNRECLFGAVNDSKIKLNDAGEMINRIWCEIPTFYKGTFLDEFIIMPNHLHGLIRLGVGVGPRAHPKIIYRDNNYKNAIKGQAQGPVPTPRTISIPNVIERFKSLTTKKYIDGIRNNSWEPFNKRLWQRNYFERIIRDKKELNKIRKYIKENPYKWKDDEYNPEKMTKM